YFQWLELRPPGDLPGSRGKQPCHRLHGSVQQLHLATEVGQPGPFGIHSSATARETAQRLGQAMVRGQLRPEAVSRSAAEIDDVGFRWNGFPFEWRKVPQR